MVIPEVPAFAGNIKDVESLKMILAAQWRTINRGPQSIFKQIRDAGFEPYVFWSQISPSAFTFFLQGGLYLFFPSAGI